jgi:gentisate 1,2-dioxygenase
MRKQHQSNRKDFPFAIGDTNGVAVNARALHWHKEMEICHIKSGSGKYLINGKEYTFIKGDIFIINNDEIHLCFDDNE